MHSSLRVTDDPKASLMASQDKLPEGIHSLLDTDLYKLTMQSAVLKYFPRTNVTYNFTNRTPDMKLNRKAFYWLQDQVERLGNITMSSAELEYLKKTCTYLSEPYLKFMETFKLRPSEQIELKFHVAQDNGSEDDEGEMEIHAKGLWVDTILYEIPLLALTSEAYFKFVDRDWSYEGQEVKAKEKGLKLLEHGCLVSEFGSRRRRDYHTHELVLEGLKKASKEGEAQGFPGKITGSSNVHFAMRFGTPPIGTVAHEWFMGVAAITNSYETATETALRYWVGTFGKGVSFVGRAVSYVANEQGTWNRLDRYIWHTRIPKSFYENHSLVHHGRVRRFINTPLSTRK